MKTTDERIKKFIALTNTKRDLEAHLDGVKRELAEIETDILSDWDLSGTQSQKINGTLVHSGRDMSVKRIGNSEQIVAVFKAVKVNRPDLINVYTQSIKTYLKERIVDDTTNTWELSRLKTNVPQAVLDVVEVMEYKRLVAKG